MTRTKWTILALTVAKVIAALAVCYCCSHVAYKAGHSEGYLVGVEAEYNRSRGIP